MKKLHVVAVLCLLTIICFGQSRQTITLKWKIGVNEKLNYSTVMSDIDTSSMELNFGKFSKDLTDSTWKGMKDADAFFKKLNQVWQNVDFISTLTNKGHGIIDIVMSTKPKEEGKESPKDTVFSKEKEMLKLMQKMNNGIMLRGSVYETGAIHSFWVKSAQKNLIAIFFQLPAKPVKVGDSWPLEVNLISNDQNFECDSSNKINRVTLMEIKKVNGETVAVIKYNILEYVKGKFNSPGFLGNDTVPELTIMKFSHQGIAQFCVEKGRWISYDGIMSLNATGALTANKKTKFTLIDRQ